MTIVERELELVKFGGLLDAAAAGSGAAVLVTGPWASGKSTLLDEFARRARGRGELVLVAEGSEEESELQLGVLEQLARHAAAGAGYDAAVTDLLAEAGEGDADGERCRAVAQTLAATLLDLAKRRPLVVLVDNVHQADAASLHGLAYLARRLPTARVLAVFAYADAAPCRLSPFRPDLLRKPFVHRMPLAPLSRKGVEQVLANRLGSDRAADFAEHFAAVSGGNPLLLGALLDDFAESSVELCADLGAGQGAGRGAEAGEERAAWPDPRAVGHYAQAVLACLHRDGGPTQEVARALAVLGRPEDVHHLLALPAEEVARHLRSLDADGLTEAGRFRHPAARSAVLADCGTRRRAQLHAVAAELEHSAGAEPRVLAEHLLGAGRAEGAWAVHALKDAAQEAMAVSDDRAATEYLRLAQTACLDDSELVCIETMLLRAQWQLNPTSSQQLLDDLVRAMRSGLMDCSEILTLARALLWNGRYSIAEEALGCLKEVDLTANPRFANELRSTREWLHATYPPLAGAVSNRGLDELGRAPLLAARGVEEAVAALSGVLGGDSPIRRSRQAEHLLRGVRVDETGMEIAECALLTLVYGERADRAAAPCDELITAARQAGARTALARLLALRAEIAVRVGDMPTAERAAGEALSTLSQAAWGVAIASPLAALMTALIAMGRDDEALAVLVRPVPEEIMASRYGLHYLQARARVELAIGDAEAALRAFRHCGELMVRWGIDVPGLVCWRTDVAEAYLRLGRRGEAEALLREQQVLSGGEWPRSLGRTLRLLALAGELPRRPALLRQAADLLGAAGDRYETAQALTDLAGACEELGEYRRARVIGQHGWRLAHDCRAQGLLSRLSTRLGRSAASTGPSVADHDGATALSNAERRVVEQASLGLTNREISARLYITVSTVEQHLTRAYRKLNVSSRAELPSFRVGMHGDKRQPVAGDRGPPVPRAVPAARWRH
jgi:DNA-binding CsgD family transcriptional regulator